MKYSSCMQDYSPNATKILIYTNKLLLEIYGHSIVMQWIKFN